MSSLAFVHEVLGLLDDDTRADAQLRHVAREECSRPGGKTTPIEGGPHDSNIGRYWNHTVHAVPVRELVEGSEEPFPWDCLGQQASAPLHVSTSAREVETSLDLKDDRPCCAATMQQFWLNHGEMLEAEMLRERVAAKRVFPTHASHRRCPGQRGLAAVQAAGFQYRSTTTRMSYLNLPRSGNPQ
ncbi:hypothetical protein CERZMDRAFT_86894 [Cercospora zeae-maydis SCOH1-5]|uniref:Uncharacterized protein n=1 Tax=Cercospora zeae-maydis SCOH1-5 TaxID=717836 RepID=A0A6A6F6J7_9PEZI|nr:hypothetical protein CERZMDRAFT_86894 [Cercospora zeae-maydis SCOH1-5]